MFFPETFRANDLVDALLLPFKIFRWGIRCPKLLDTLVYISISSLYNNVVSTNWRFNFVSESELSREID